MKHTFPKIDSITWEQTPPNRRLSDCVRAETINYQRVWPAQQPTQSETPAQHEEEDSVLGLMAEVAGAVFKMAAVAIIAAAKSHVDATIRRRHLQELAASARRNYGQYDIVRTKGKDNAKIVVNVNPTIIINDK